ncbi:MAG: DUF3078 domain-containing protein [Ginsengibacter sp.]
MKTYFIIQPRFIFKFLFLTAFVAFSQIANAQDPTVKDLKDNATKEIKKENIDSSKVWHTGGVFNLNIGQGSQSNWSAGGDDFSFTLNSYFGVFAFYKKEKISWDNTLDLNFGYLNTTSLGSRKNDDRIDVLSKLGYALHPKLDLTALFNVRTQFAKGYNYTGSDTKELLSNFFAPGYVLLSLGLNYKPAEGLSIFVSPLTSRWTIVNDDSLSAKGAYGVTPGKKVKNEIGAFASIKYLKNLNKSISYNGRLDLFSNYQHNPQNVDVLMNNLFTAKLSKVLAASLELDLIYDDDIKLFGPNNDSPALQLKSLIGVGLTVKF